MKCTSSTCDFPGWGSSGFYFKCRCQVLLLIFYSLNWQGPGVMRGKRRLCQAEISIEALSQLRSNANGLSGTPAKPSTPEKMMPTAQGWAEHLKSRETRAGLQIFIIKQLPYWSWWKGRAFCNGETYKWFIFFVSVCVSVCAGVC